MALISPATAADAACEPAKVAQKYPGLAGKTIKIGADPQTPPYIMRDKTDFNKVVGIDADLSRAVFDCAGLKYEFVLGAWSGILPAVQSGQLDVMWDDLYYKPARAEVVDFVIYMQAATGALVQKGNPKKIARIEDLCGLTVSFGVGSSNELAVKKQNEACKAAQKSEINMMPFQDLAAGLRLLDSERADAIMWDLGFVDNLAATNPEKYARGFAIMDGLEVGAAVKKGNAELLQVISDGMQVVQKTDQQKKILQTYGVDAALQLPAATKTK
ncbi:ABC transporter substrate-binding protein [Bradyrhizobium sp. BR 10289]|nr:ABC transporter substrate-binding protein [Bradyrhizobium sp. BR 10289]MBW7970257.1 ABC transporter substrate-binding protein [Bradyrhizobium sp. BR 10289]